MKTVLVMMMSVVGAVFGCTTLAASRGATLDGSVITSHSNDGAGDAIGRFHHIPAADWPAGSIRPPGIPQVPHTYSYHTEGYAAMNQWQVGLAESTCSAVYGDGPHALLSIVDLGQIALERSTTAREAVQIMGNLSVQYGFKSSASFEGAGESLFVSDPTEVFVFQILPDSTGNSSIWAAQRIPDKHVAVVANFFTIREITAGSSSFLFSDNIFTEAKTLGWDGSSPLDFTRFFASAEVHKFYSGRRMWGAYLLLASKQNFSDEYGDLQHDAPYPVSTTPDAFNTTIFTLMKVMRYHYEGTKHDLTAGIAAGPFGTPSRWVGVTGGANVTGFFERAIGIYRTIVSYVTQARSWLPNEIGGVVWFAPHAAHTSCYVPFPVSMTEIPPGYSNTTGTLSRDHAFWVHRILLNVAQIKYMYMIQDIQAQQNTSERGSQALQIAAEAAYKTDGNITAFNDKFAANANQTIKTFSALIDWLLQHYPDGYCNGCGKGPHAIGYPAWWLKEVGYTSQTPAQCINACPDTSLPVYKECVQNCL